MLITDRPADAANAAVDPLRNWIRRQCARQRSQAIGR